MPFCDDEMAMIAAIHDDPKNDVRRLAYADWLAAHGRADLAELIGLTCREPYYDLVMSRTIPWRSKLDVGFMDVEEAEPDRIRRSIELLNGIYGSERLPECDFYEYNRRGLPVCEIGTERYPYLLRPDELQAMPLTRFRLSLHTSSLAKWLAHPIMRRVDILRYYPEFDWEAEGDAVNHRSRSAGVARHTAARPPRSGGLVRLPGLRTRSDERVEEAGHGGSQLLRFVRRTFTSSLGPNTLLNASLTTAG